MTPDLCDFAWRIAGYLFVALVSFAAGLTISVWFEKVPDVTARLKAMEDLQEAKERGERR